jgi:hypothetical protein
MMMMIMIIFHRRYITLKHVWTVTEVNRIMTCRNIEKSFSSEEKACKLKNKVI